MFMKTSLLALAAAASLPAVFARELIIERDGRPFYPRRFGQEQCGGLGGQIGSACAGEICGVLGGRLPGVLLAAAAECAQQNLADDIIDASKTQDATTATNMVALAIKARQCEKNTPPDFTKNPPALRNSVFCQQAPRNPQLDGLVQAQDPANDPTLFFDVVTKTTVLKGSQANTFPFGQASGNSSPDVASTSAAESVADVATTTAAAVDEAATTTAAATGDCPTAVTVTVTPTPAASIADVASTSVCTTPQTFTVTVGAAEATTTAAAAESTTAEAIADVTTSSAAAAATTPVAVSNAAGSPLDFGSCTNPAVEFGPGFEGRKLSEFTFEPENKSEFAQGSALNGQIVLTAICNILNDKCKAPASTVTACKNAVTAAASVTGGAKADLFNGALGITSDFANVPAAPGGGQGSIAQATTANFNLCAVPSIAFGIFDGRTENSFEPVGSDFQHGSALNPAIITTFVCDQLVNKCNANQVAINDCQTAITATNGLSGQALADAFNAAVSAHVA